MVINAVIIITTLFPFYLSNSLNSNFEGPQKRKEKTGRSKSKP